MEVLEVMEVGALPLMGSTERSPGTQLVLTKW